MEHNASISSSINSGSNDASSQKARRWLRPLLVICGGVVVLILALGLYVYSVSPAAIRAPEMEHYHFRMQIIVQGKAENFSQSKYQHPHAKGQCTMDLTAEPIHFHDKKDQMVHIHWDGMTGGIVLKNYGWNFIGGQSGVLGYKLDTLPKIRKIPTHGNPLPPLSPQTRLFVYIGDQNSYQEKSFDDFISQDLEQFFDKKSNLDIESTEGATILDTLFPTAKAADKQHGQHSETEDEKLTRVNNLLGNVVIFAQNEKPHDAAIKERFNKLDPLSLSTCGG